MGKLMGAFIETFSNEMLKNLDSFIKVRWTLKIFCNIRKDWTMLGAKQWSIIVSGCSLKSTIVYFGFLCLVQSLSWFECVSTIFKSIHWKSHCSNSIVPLQTYDRRVKCHTLCEDMKTAAEQAECRKENCENFNVEEFRFEKDERSPGGLKLEDYDDSDIPIILK